jgi:hypothetical protein
VQLLHDLEMFHSSSSGVVCMLTLFVCLLPMRKVYRDLRHGNREQQGLGPSCLHVSPHLGPP